MMLIFGFSIRPDQQSITGLNIKERKPIDSLMLYLYILYYIWESFGVQYLITGTETPTI